MNHSAITAAHVKTLSIRAEAKSIEDFLEGNELPLMLCVEADEVHPFLIMTGANRDHSLAIRRNQHLQRHIADADMLSGGGEAQAVEQQVGVGREMLPYSNGGAGNIFGRGPAVRLPAERGKERYAEQEERRLREQFHYCSKF